MYRLAGPLLCLFNTKLEIGILQVVPPQWQATFFTRTRQKGSDGPLEVITTVTETTESFKSEVKLKISCTFCEKSFGNPGAFECHRLMKHPGRREMGDKICLS